ncbi:RsmE family RNA methyltransferase, partial [bacterium]|nr:RsmE family RNA methyltransferase [bacterium]
NEAVKQCERRTVPVLHGVESIGAVLGHAAQSWPLKLVASLDSDIPLHDCRGGEAGILIGPEGGFAPDETAKILASGFRPVHMGKTILRACTAAVTAVGILAM